MGLPDDADSLTSKASRKAGQRHNWLATREAQTLGASVLCLENLDHALRLALLTTKTASRNISGRDSTRSGVQLPNLGSEFWWDVVRVDAAIPVHNPVFSRVWMLSAA